MTPKWLRTTTVLENSESYLKVDEIILFIHMSRTEEGLKILSSTLYKYQPLL